MNHDFDEITKVPTNFAENYPNNFQIKIFCSHVEITSFDPTIFKIVPPGLNNYGTKN